MTIKAYRDEWREDLAYPFSSMRSYYSDELGEDGMDLLSRTEDLWVEGAADVMLLEAEAMTFAILIHRGTIFKSKRHMITHWFQVEGLQFVFDALRLLRQEPMMFRYAHYDSPLFAIYDEKELDAYILVRRLLATVSDKEYDAIRTHLDKGFDDADLFTQCMLAFCFPDCESWGDKALEGYIQHRDNELSMSDHGMIMAAFASGGALALKQQVMEKHAFNPYQRYELLFSMLDVIGSDSLSLLRPMYAGRWWSYDSRIAEALATIESEEVCDLFADGSDRRETAL